MIATIGPSDSLSFFSTSAKWLIDKMINIVYHSLDADR